MPEVLILEFAGVTEAEYAAVNKHLGIDMRTGQGDWPPGLLSHAAGLPTTARSSSRRCGPRGPTRTRSMTSRLGAALAAGGVTAYPKIQWVPLLAYHQPGA